MNEKFELLINSFIDNKVGISEDFLSKPLAKILKNNIENLNNDGLMLNAGIGNRLNKSENKKIRSDKICWIEKKNKYDHEKEFIDQIENFIDYMNKTCFTNIKGYEFHYALYEIGSFYKIHKDQFQNDSSRKFTLVNYLNEAWNEDDGGELVIYQDEQVQKILPNNQKSVFFQSDKIDHEVKVSSKLRMSVTGWLKV